jgi:DNA replication and repair protein RecF
MRARLTRLTLTDFRSYRQESLQTGGRSTFLFGPNGAGKTNLLEAISLFSPGRGLRGAGASELGRRERADAEPKPWAVALEAEVGEETIHLGAGVASETGVRRVARVAGEPAQVSAFADYVRPIWLTPAHDRLFAGPAGDRRRFLDRLVMSAAPAHGKEAAAYEHALRERSLLLAEGRADPTWLEALEARAAASGARIAIARAEAVRDIAAEIDARGKGPFPAADVSLACPWSAMAAESAIEGEIEVRLAKALAAGRARDAAAGRALVGPHRADLEVATRESGRSAALSSTGEQKALILNLILAQAGRLSRAISAPNPILLLDEVAAHLDAGKRAALFDEIEALALQAFLTGADESLFDTLRGRALAVRVDGSKLTPLDVNE